MKIHIVFAVLVIVSSVCVAQKNLSELLDASGKAVLSAGEYTGLLHVKSKKVVLTGNKAGGTVLVGGEQKFVAYVVDGGELTLKNVSFKVEEKKHIPVFVSKGTVHLENVTFDGIGKYACYVDSGTLTAKDCTFKNLKDIGVAGFKQSSLTVEDSIFTSCAKNAIHVQESGSVKVRNCTFNEIGGSAVLGLGGADIEFLECKVSKTKRSAVQSESNGKLLIADCTFMDLEDGALTALKQTPLSVSGSTFKNIPKTAIYVQAGGNGAIETCTFENLGQGAISGFDVGDLRVKECSFRRVSDAAVFVKNSNSVLVDRNLFDNVGFAVSTQGVNGAVTVQHNRCINGPTKSGFAGIKGPGEIRVINNSVSGYASGLSVEGTLNKTLEISSNTITDISGGAVFLECHNPNNKAALTVKNNAVVNAANYALLLNKATNAVVEGNVFHSPKMALSVQQNSSALLNSNILYAPEAALNFFKSEEGKTKLFSEVIIGEIRNANPVDETETNAKLSVWLKDPDNQSLFRKTLDEMLAVKGAKSQEDFESIAALGSLLRKQHRKAVDASKVIAGVTLKIEDASGRKFFRPFSVYEGTYLRYGSAKVIAADLKDPAALLYEIKNPSNGRAVFVAGKMKVDMKGEEVLVDELNRIIEGDSLWDEGLFGEVPKRKDEARMNRTIVEKAFPGMLFSTEKIAESTSEKPVVRLRSGSYWLVPNFDLSLNTKVTLSQGATEEAVIQVENGLFLTFKTDGKEPKSREVFVKLKPKEEMRKALAEYRHTWLYTRSVPRRCNVTLEDAQQAMDLALKCLEETPANPYKDKSLEDAEKQWISKNRSWAKRILPVYGDRKTVEKLMRLDSDLSSGLKAIRIKISAQIENRLGILDTGSVRKALNSNDPEIYGEAAMPIASKFFFIRPVL